MATNPLRVRSYIQHRSKPIGHRLRSVARSTHALDVGWPDDLLTATDWTLFRILCDAKQLPALEQRDDVYGVARHSSTPAST